MIDSSTTLCHLVKWFNIWIQEICLIICNFVKCALLWSFLLQTESVYNQPEHADTSVRAFILFYIVTTFK